MKPFGKISKNKRTDADGLEYIETEVSEESTHLFYQLDKRDTDLPNLPSYWSVIHDVSIIQLHFHPQKPYKMTEKKKFSMYCVVQAADLKFEGKSVWKNYAQMKNMDTLFDEVALVLTRVDSVEESQRIVERSHQNLVKYFHSGQLDKQSWKKVIEEISFMTSKFGYYSPAQKSKLKEFFKFWDQHLCLRAELKALENS